MEFLLHFVSTIGLFLPSVLAYNLLFGKGKILYFGPIAVSLVAAYATFLTLRHTGSYPLALGAGLAGATALSLLFTWLSLRLEPDGFGVMSIAVHLAIMSIVLNWTGLTRGALGIPGLPRLPFMETPLGFAVVTVLIAAVWVTSMWLLNRSAFGRKMQALAEQGWYAQGLGISRAKTHAAAFVIAGVGVTITNVLYPQYLRLLHPNDFAFPFVPMFIMFVVAGFPGSVKGVTLSTALLIALREGLRFLELPPDVLGPMRLILFGVVLFAAVWWRRDTLFPVQRSV